MKRNLYALALLLTGGMLVSTLPLRLEAQSIQSSILGNVRDSAGAAAPGATVTLTNEGTNDERKQTTDTAGDYRFSGILAGTYRVSVELAGLQRPYHQGDHRQRERGQACRRNPGSR